MTDGLDLSGIISALGGEGGDLASKLSSALGGEGGDLASKLSSALGGGDSDLASKLPEALKNLDLAGLLSSVKSAQSDGQSAAGEGEAAKGSDSLGAALPSVVAALSRGGDERSKQRRALLSAIRPFVSEKRKRAIDALVGFEKLTAVLPGVK